MKTVSRNMFRIVKIPALSLAAVALALLVHAQAPKSPNQTRSETDSAPSMQSMMDQCAKQCNGTMQQCDSVMKKLREARDSNDAAKMRSAIDETLKMCEQMMSMAGQCTEENRKACMQMMDTMGRMHGGMMQSEGSSKDAKKK